MLMPISMAGVGTPVYAKEMGSKLDDNQKTIHLTTPITQPNRIKYSIDISESSDHLLNLKLKENVEAFVDLNELVKQKDSRSQIKYLRERCETALQVFGFYDAHCEITIDSPAGTESQELVKLQYRITPNQPVLIRTLNIHIEGEAKKSRQFMALLEGSALKRGKPFQHDHYESLKRDLQDLAFESGYFDAQFQVRRVDIYAEELVADVHLLYNSAKRYRFGETTVEGAEIDPSLLTSLFTYEKGDPYNASALVNFHNHLLQTGYFTKVRVVPQLNKLSEQSVPVKIELGMKPKNTVRLGIGYATDVRTRLRAGWIKPWISRRGRSLSVQSEGSAVKQKFDVKFSTPLVGKVDHLYTQSLSWEGDETEDRETVSLAFRYTRPLTGKEKRVDRSRRWILSPFLRIDNENFFESGQEVEATTIVPGVEVWRRRKRGGLDPYWGDYLRFGYETGFDEVLSELNFHQLTLDGKLIRSLFNEGEQSPYRLIASLNLGALISGDSVGELPDSFRFRAGGDQSIRGFAYKSVGPESDEIDAEGAKYLATASLEYDWAFKEKWRLALFVDSGDAFNETFDPHVGTGFGLRWFSPVGPIKVDFAFAVSEESNPFRLHFTMGLDL